MTAGRKHVRRHEGRVRRGAIQATQFSPKAGSLPSARPEAVGGKWSKRARTVREGAPPVAKMVTRIAWGRGWSEMNEMREKVMR